MLLLLMTKDKKNAKQYTPKKRIITKLATSRTLTITIQVNTSQLKIEHLANTNVSSNLFDIFERCGHDQSTD